MGQRRKFTGLEVRLLFCPSLPDFSKLLPPHPEGPSYWRTPSIDSIPWSVPTSKVLPYLKILNPALIHFQFKILQKKGNESESFSCEKRVPKYSWPLWSPMCPGIATAWDFVCLKREWLMRRRWLQVEVYRFGSQNRVCHTFCHAWVVCFAARTPG